MKFPSNARSVYKGKIFEVFEWEQELYDGTTDTFEALKRPDTIQIIPTRSTSSLQSGGQAGQAKILISREEQPYKPLSDTLLGGRAEEGEEPLITAKRELLEETGLESSDWELLKVFEIDGKIDWTIYLFVARNCKKVAEQNLDAGERIEVREVGFEEFLDTVTHEDFWGQTIANYILRLRLNPEKLEEFKKKLFP